MARNQRVWLKPIWKTNNRKWRDSLHTICSYLAMFPPSLPNYFIKQFTDEGDKIYDPFSGRGTTVLEAALNNREGIGNDLNPLAYVLTGAKTYVPKYTNIMRRLCELEENFNNIYISRENILRIDPDIRMLYDEEITLPMLLYLKNELDIRRKIDRYIMAILLGIMHGKHRKDGTSIYLSISMPNTFSMSPNYVRKYIAENNLVKLQQNVFELLRDRIAKTYPWNNTLRKGKSYQYDALKINNYRRILENEAIDLIVTSPPYLKLIRYGKYNWIRLWMLGKDFDRVDDKLKINKAYEEGSNIKLSDRLKLEEYLVFMRNLICGWERILKPGALACIVIGDVEELKLAEEVWEYVEPYTNLQLVEIVEDKIEGNNKVTKIWGQERKGEATKVDRILIISKGEPRKPKFTTNAQIKKNFKYFYE
ncbi:MAG: DNA methyltransferase [Marinisporobacter sp.]|nr:DNA methyltransferase [Marinisporobacter sp.]